LADFSPWEFFMTLKSKSAMVASSLTLAVPKTVLCSEEVSYEIEISN
jgi:hypothetical protein